MAASAEALNTTVFSFFGSMPPARATAAIAEWFAPPKLVPTEMLRAPGSCLRRATRSAALLSGESVFTAMTTYSLCSNASGVTSV
ncbi:hypothetical protein D3C83_51190 [compost metagenome]